MIMKGTNEQEELWNEIANGEGHVMVYAGASNDISQFRIIFD